MPHLLDNYLNYGTHYLMMYAAATMSVLWKAEKRRHLSNFNNVTLV